jgi:hypothetical protein
MSIARFKNVEELLGFAREFFDNRVETFQKDTAICRTPDARGQHAYFPALITCHCIRRATKWLLCRKAEWGGAERP